MFDIKLKDDLLVDTEGTSDGTQCKYYENGYWYKTDNEGAEGVVEYLVSKLLTFSDLPIDSYVLYEQGRINGKRGCRSKTFFGKGEAFVTLERMHQNVSGQPLFESMKLRRMEDAIEYVLRFFEDIAHINLFEYFQRVFTLDYISLNEDRHFHNLGIIMDSKGGYRAAPIFDNGKSLLNANPSINFKHSIEENVKKVTARPFSGSHERMFHYFGAGFHLDINGAISWLESEADSFYKEVLFYQLTHTEL